MEAVVFDWDGTLVDTLRDLYRANVEVLAAFGLPFDERRYRRHYAPDWRLMYRRLGIPADRLDEANDRWLAAFGAGAGLRPFDGVAEGLGRLRRIGVGTGLVTAGHRSIVEPQVRRLGLEALLAVRVYGDDLPVHKPDPRPLFRVLDCLGLRPTSATVAYVGDAPDDMRMAKAAGVLAVGIPSLLSSPRSLRRAGADIVADSAATWIAGLAGQDGA